jgi:hypothetical protein
VSTPTCCGNLGQLGEPADRLLGSGQRGKPHLDVVDDRLETDRRQPVRDRQHPLTHGGNADVERRGEVGEWPTASDDEAGGERGEVIALQPPLPLRRHHRDRRHIGPQPSRSFAYVVTEGTLAARTGLGD